MVNIVMLVHNRLRLTEQALRTLAQNTPADSYTLALVDDASDDFRTARLLTNYALQRSNATHLRIEKSPHVLARGKNIGVAWSEQVFGRGDWLYLSDNDVAFLPGWITQMVQVAEASEPRGFKLWGGQVHPFHQPINNGAFCVQEIWGDEKEFARWTEHQVLDGPSWLMRWDTWNKIGPFSRECAPGPCQSEDAEWCARLVAAGGRIGVVHPHVVAHTGLTQTDGKDAPGRAAREAGMMEGVFYE